MSRLWAIISLFPFIPIQFSTLLWIFSCYIGRRNSINEQLIFHLLPMNSEILLNFTETWIRIFRGLPAGPTPQKTIHSPDSSTCPIPPHQSFIIYLNVQKCSFNFKLFCVWSGLDFGQTNIELLTTETKHKHSNGWKCSEQLSNLMLPWYSHATLTQGLTYTFAIYIAISNWCIQSNFN